jgi:hypothetical protein
MMDKIPDSVLKLMTKEGFMELFWSKVTSGMTYRKAYEEVENEHFSVFQKRRYASFDSFEVVLYRKKNR